MSAVERVKLPLTKLCTYGGGPCDTCSKRGPGTRYVWKERDIVHICNECQEKHHLGSKEVPDGS